MMTHNELELKDASGLREAVNGIFEDFFCGRPVRAARTEDAESAWAPACDIRETEDGFEVRAYLPGVDKSEISVEVKENTLTLSGQRKAEGAEGGWLRREMPAGPFYRAFALPVSLAADKVSASSHNGVLAIKLPKAEQAKGRKVEVR